MVLSFRRTLPAFVGVFICCLMIPICSALKGDISVKNEMTEDMNNQIRIKSFQRATIPACTSCVNVDVYFTVFRDDDGGMIGYHPSQFFNITGLNQVTTETMNEQFRILVDAFETSVFTFTLKQIEFVDNTKYFRNFDRDEREIQTLFRKGNSYDMNVYFGGANKGSYTFFPELLSRDAFGQQLEQPIDGLFIDISNLPGIDTSEFARNTLGKTLITTTGFWMGLYRVFEDHGKWIDDPCSVENPQDYVADTPQQASATEFNCPQFKDSCPNLPGTDSINNYMDFSSDDCLTEFTPGQFKRMYLVWALFRQPDQPCSVDEALFELQITTPIEDRDFKFSWILQSISEPYVFNVSRQETINNVEDLFDYDKYEAGATIKHDFCIPHGSYILTVDQNTGGSFQVSMDGQILIPLSTIENISYNLVAGPIDLVLTNICFSGETFVHVQEKGQILMKDLQVGDKVLTTESGKFDTVYSFGHRDVSQEGKFLQLGPSNLEISPHHMVFVQGRGAIPAAHVKVGDRLAPDMIAVTSIQEITRRGVFSPFTYSGKILVNGVLASNYVALQDSAVLQIGDSSIPTPFTFQWLGHSFLFPYRLYSLFVREDYALDNSNSSSNNGLSRYSYYGLLFAQWLIQQKPWMMSFLFLPIILVLSLFNILEVVFNFCCQSTCSICVWAISLLLLASMPTMATRINNSLVHPPKGRT